MALRRLKICREFQEFQDLSDAECERVILLLRERHRAVHALRRPAEAVVLAMVFGSVLYLAGLAIFVLVLPTLPRRTADIADLVLVVGAVSPAVVITTVVREGFARRWFRSLVREALRARVIDASACPGCGYSFMGLPSRGDAVRCPECGGVTSLAITSELRDLIASVRPTPSSPPPSP